MHLLAESEYAQNNENGDYALTDGESDCSMGWSLGLSPVPSAFSV